MSILISSDLHLTAKPLDVYKWGLFPWIIDQIDKLDITHIYFLGDLTDAKDEHPAKLTNKVVEALVDLCNHEHIKRVVCLRGNHDYIDPSTPFFKFISTIPKLAFIIKPTMHVINTKSIFLLPNSRNPEEEWQQEINKFPTMDYIMIHQTLEGSIGENGYKLQGINSDIFSKVDKKKTSIISGDVHVPQNLHGVTYVGSPYHVHFGDKFTPRVLLLNVDEKTFTDLHYQTISRHTFNIESIKDLSNLEVKENDQVNFKVWVDDVLDWDKCKMEIKKFCEAKKVYLHKTTFHKKQTETPKPITESKFKIMLPKEVLQQYVSEAKITNSVIPFGQEILTDVEKI